MQYSGHRYYHKSCDIEDDSQFNSRMFTNTVLPQTDYVPYPDTFSEPDGILGKMTSRISGMCKVLKNAVGSIGEILKHKEEESTITTSTFPSKIEISIRDANSLPLQNHAITKINFTELSHILQNDLSKPNSNKVDPTKSNDAINVSFGGSNNSTLNQDALNQSTFSFQSQTNSISGKESNYSQKHALGNAKHRTIKKRKPMNLMRCINFWQNIYDEQCRKYAQAHQKSFTRNLRSILTEGVRKPVPNKTGQPSIEFKLNKITGAYEAVRIRKKRKTMDIEPLESQLLGEKAPKASQLIEKDITIRPNIKKMKEPFLLSQKMAGASISVKLNKSKLINEQNNKAQKKRMSIFVDKLGQSPKEEEKEGQKSFYRAKSPVRNIIFEEDRHWNRSTDTDSGIGEGKVFGNAILREQGSQTSGSKQNKPFHKADISCQTSPLRSKSIPLFSAGSLKGPFDEIKEDTQIKQQSSSNNIPQNLSEQINEETTEIIQQQNIVTKDAEESSKAEKPTIETNIEEKIERNLPKSLPFTAFEHIASQKSLEVEDVKTNSEVNVLASANFEIRENLSNQPICIAIRDKQENPDSKLLFKESPSKYVEMNLKESVSQINPSKDETKVNNPTLDFLKPYEAKNSNIIQEDNPFLVSKHQPTPEGNQIVNPAKTSNPFLNLQNTQLDILGIIERNSSDKKSTHSFDRGLKPVTNLGLFENKSIQQTISINPLTNLPIQTQNNGLLNNISIFNNSQNMNTNNLAPNSLSNNLSSTYLPNSKPGNLFSNNLFCKDEMDITESKPLANTSNNLFAPNVSQNNSLTTNFLTNGNNKSISNSFFGNLVTNHQNSEMMNESNNCFSNNLFGGNTAITQTSSSLFSHQNVNPHPSTQLFSNPSMSNDQQPPNNLFSSNINQNTGFMTNNLSFGNSQSDKMLNQSQVSINLFSNLQPPNNQLQNKLNFNNQSLFENKSSNLSVVNSFENNFSAQTFQTSQGMNSNQNIGSLLSERSTQDAVNFLGLGNNSNTTNINNANESNQQSQQNRVYRKIIQLGNKNKERAF